VKGTLLGAKLSSELRKKHNTRSMRVRKDDKVKILRGQFKGTIGAVTEVKLKASRIYVAGSEVVKKDGSKAKYPIHPSNVEIIELTTKDKKRLEVKTAAPKKEASGSKTSKAAETVSSAKKAAPKAGDTKKE
jgi:large subunit ribosomal protein L24